MWVVLIWTIMVEVKGVLGLLHQVLWGEREKEEGEKQVVVMV